MSVDKQSLLNFFSVFSVSYDIWLSHHTFCFQFEINILILRSVHMERFAYVCKFCIYAKFAYVCKSLHVYAFTHVCKICMYAKVGKFAPASDQVQISFCVYANFAYMQIWSCERKAKFAHVSIYLIVLNNLEMTLFQDCNYLVNNSI